MMRALPLLALLTAAAGCASSGATPRPFPAPGRTLPVALPSAAGLGAAVADTALALRGVPYRNGGSDPSGFDCSGLVWYVFAQHGLALPRTVSEQYRRGSPVNPQQLQKGDLVFFRTAGSGPTHVGIMIDGEAFVHAPSSNGQVRMEQLAAAYWSRRLVGARRLGLVGSRFPVQGSRF